jgi:hypothetical protein
MSSFFRKSNLMSIPSQIFRKGSSLSQSIFRKGGGLDTLSGGLGRASGVLGDIARESNKVLSSPAAQQIATLSGDNGLKLLAGMKGTAQSVDLAGRLAGQGAGLTNRRNYNGSAGDTVTNILERGKKMADTGAEGHGIQFA